MKNLVFILVIALFAGMAQGQNRPQQERDSTWTYVTVPVNLSLWSRISIGQAMAPPAEHRVRQRFALHLLSGRAAQLSGIEISGLAGAITEDARGVQIAGLAAVTGEHFRGIQVAGLAAVVGENRSGIQVGGLAAVTGEHAEGIQVGGLAAVVGEDQRGIQAGGLFAVAGENVRGIQAGGLFAVSGENAQGLQWGGIGAITGEDFRGIQNSGVMSIVGENMYGLQTSSVMNITGGTLRGVQAGFLNIAPNVRGMQIGFFNISDTLRGVPIGAVSYVRSVGLEQDVWGDETGTIHTSIRSGTRRISNFGGIGVRPGGDARYRWSAHTGIGMELPVSATAFLALDALSMIYISESFDARPDPALKLRLSGIVRFSPQLAVFAGGSLTGLISREANPDLLPGKALATDTVDGDTFTLWSGGHLGIRFQIQPPKR